MSGTSTGHGRYCELHAHSCYSLLDGVPLPEELAERAAELGLPAIALTDHDAPYGIVPFYFRARALGIKPILGAEITLDDGAHLTLLAETGAGYANLCQLISKARLNASKGEASLAWAELPKHARGVICLTGCRLGPVAHRLEAGDFVGARRALSHLIALFGPEHLYVELQRNLRRNDARLSRQLTALAMERGLKCVATGNAHYLSRDDADLQSVLVSIRERLPLPKAAEYGRRRTLPLRPNHEYFLNSTAGMNALYPDLPDAVSNTLEIAERCNVELPIGLQILPAFPTPRGIDTQAHLRQLCLERLLERYPRSHYSSRYTQHASSLIEKELNLIASLDLANYFLIVWDIVNFCRRQGILCHGRGSAANSLVAHLLDISAVDPISQGLVVERFLSVEHGGTPDIDLDIDAARREAVIQYVYQRWGRDHAAMACTYVTYRSASAIRDAGFALGFKQETIEEIAANLESERRGRELDEDGRVDRQDTPVTELAAQQGKLSSAEWQRLVTMAERLRGRPRHLGLHNGGMVITGNPIAGVIPIEPATMENRTVTQFDKEWLEQLGLVKIDLLGLRMLSAIADTISMVKESHRTRIDLHQLDFRDRAVYDQICSAQTVGIFQVESGAQVSVIPHMQPRRFQDLVVEISLIRPGPLQGNMVRPYLRRRQGLEPITYPHPSLKNALEETLGVIVFQEQVIKIARDFSGFTAGRGELLRRALGHKNAAGEIQKFRAEFLEGAITHGAKREIAEEVWGMLESFAGYSFSKAHAAAFAVIVYWSAWLRVHYPVEYFCGLLRNAPLGTYPANVLESEARRVGVKFLPFDVNRSHGKAIVEKGAIRFGLDYVRGIGVERAEKIVQTRGSRPFTSVADFIRRTATDRRAVESLILSGAFDSFGERRQLLWDLAEALEIACRPKEARLPLDIPDEQATMPAMPADQKLLLTFASTGVTAGAHLVEIRRDAFTRAGCTPYRELKKLRNGATVRVGGLIADGLRRPPTAKGTSFIRIEEPDGIMDVVIPPEAYAGARTALRLAFVVVEGVLERKAPVPAILAKRVWPLP